MFSRILLPLSKQSFQIERVKFGAALEQVCNNYNDLPGPLLVLILKLNKEAPYKKDVFRAPGHQSNMKKMIHCLQTGRLVNIDNYSVYTIASVLKKFLRKLPGGVFGVQLETMLFDLVRQSEMPLADKQQQMAHLLARLPLVNQHLLVLLFGTFNAIANCAQQANTGMTSEAIGVSVAPSFFHSCVAAGCKVARMEDVQRFKLATLVTQFLIDNFGVSDLFGRDNYEYYARISGRLLRVEANWVFAYKYPPMASPLAAAYGMPASQTQRAGSISASGQPATPTGPAATSPTGSAASARPSVAADAATLHLPSTSTAGSGSYCPLANQSYGRLSMSLEDSVFKCAGNSALSASSSCSTSVVTSSSGCSAPVTMRSGTGSAGASGKLVTIFDARSNSPACGASANCAPCEPDEQQLQKLSLDQLKVVNRYAESTKSLSFLPMVHERQTARMKTRSEWFLNPSETSGGESDDEHHRPQSSGFGLLGTGLTARMEPADAVGGGGSSSSSSSSGRKPIVRKSSSKEKRLVRRSSSKKDKENGAGLLPGSDSSPKFGVLMSDTRLDDDFTESANYKPRI